MTEEVLFEIEKKMGNPEIAENLRDIADKVEAGEAITLEAGTQKVELETDRDAVFEIKAEREDGEESLELEIEWKKDESSDFQVK